MTVMSSNRPAQLATEFLTFRLGSEEYCIDILKVREIRGYEPPTRIANAPSFIRGVINLRGLIVPIVDLRLKFSCDEAPYDDFTVVIILALGERTVGVVVDSVSDVLQIEPELVREAPQIDTVVDDSCITGLASVGERMLIVLDIERLMSGADMGLLPV
ncbi:MAG: chemotaxis protein CheW [Betaproteobacteria bacterium]|nr:chemotaxis protein CheW [Betaproteobacteria bacterium]